MFAVPESLLLPTLVIQQIILVVCRCGFSTHRLSTRSTAAVSITPAGLNTQGQHDADRHWHAGQSRGRLNYTTSLPLEPGQRPAA